MDDATRQAQKPGMTTEEKVAIATHKVQVDGVKLKRALADLGLPKATYFYYIKKARQRAEAEQRDAA